MAGCRRVRLVALLVAFGVPLAGVTAAVAAIWSGYLWSLQPVSQALASPGKAPLLMWFDVQAHCERDCTVRHRYVMLSTRAETRGFEALLPDRLASVRQIGPKPVPVTAMPAPADAFRKLSQAYEGNLVARMFAREGLHQVSFSSEMIAGPNQLEVQYRQLMSVRGEGTENVALGFIFDASTLAAWQRAEQFKATVKVTFGPGMLDVLKRIGMKADAVGVGCNVGGGKRIPADQMQRQPASKDEIWLEFAGEAPSSIWCVFAAPGRTG